MSYKWAVFLAPMTASEDIVVTLASTTVVDPREGKYATPVWASLEAT
jgi:hypothetical protein